MRGFCKCDLCGSVYREYDNEFYDGITVWWKNCSGTKCFPKDGEKLITPDGESTDIPATMDVCPNCFQQFYNWIWSNIGEKSKSLVNDKNFPMNPPE